MRVAEPCERPRGEVDRDVIESAGGLTDLREYSRWKNLCETRLESVRAECRSGGSTGRQSSLIARIARLAGVLNDLRSRFEKRESDSREGFAWVEIETAFDRRVLTGAIVNSGYLEPRLFLEAARDEALERVRGCLERHACLKVNTVFNGEFVAKDMVAVKAISTKNRQLFRSSDLAEWYDRRVIDATLTKLEEFQERDSGWALSSVLNLTLHINKCNPMRAGCWIEVPLWIRSKKAVVNVRATDNACFAWAVTAALYPAKNNVCRIGEYPHYSTVLDFGGIEFPVTPRQIDRFERQNDKVSINVYTIQETRSGDDRRIVPLRLTDNKRDGHVNLLYLPDARCRDVGHFVWIRNLSRLIGYQLNRSTRTMHVCDRCLHYFYTKERLIAHSVDCARVNDCAVVLPTEDDRWLFFRDHSRKERLPFVVYADMECLLEKKRAHCEDIANSYSYQHHKVFSIGYYICGPRGESAYRFRRGSDCVTWFVDELRVVAHRAKTHLSANVPMCELTSVEKRDFAGATRCHICGRTFRSEDRRVRDHCHLTGRYRGPAHSYCNLLYRNSFVVPVFFHNLSGYDAHFIIRRIANEFDGKLELLPINKETYISFSKSVKETRDDQGRLVKLRFVDSFKFLNTSLEKLVSYLDRNKLRIARTELAELSVEDFELLARKGVFPYEYVDGWDKLLDTRLPSRENFYSSLTGETVTESDYERASKVWRRFRVRDLGEYSDLYLKMDVLLLADVFENFRDTCVKSYGLDPAHYYTLPGYAWDAMLKHTGVVMELLTDIDMVMFVERGVRGGLSQCSNRYARANNKYAPSSHDPSKPSTYLMYFDVNNLYGWAMSEPLPHGRFEWVEDAQSLDAMSVASDSAVGYILEVDLAYPRELHDEHADLPFCPTRAAPPGKRSEKLLATLNDKSHYVIHYRNLQQCVKHGLRVTRIHRALRFAQSPWLRDYIDLNTRFRVNAGNEFEKNLFKLMNNAVFGKTMENVREHVDVRLVTRWDGRFGAEAMIARPNFHSRSVFSEDLMAVELRRLQVRLEKPIYVGMCVLEISKIRLYEFHYEYMAPLYRDKCKIMYTDTDSLIYHIECDDVYENVRRDIARFDTSDYPDRNVYDMPRANRKVPGLMKDENCGAVMIEFVGLRAKMYALRVLGRDETKRIKGVKRHVVAREITFDDYARCLRDTCEQFRRQSFVRSRLHEVYTVSELKLALSPYDDKRYVEPESCATLPWGHYGIPS